MNWGRICGVVGDAPAKVVPAKAEAMGGALRRRARRVTWVSCCMPVVAPNVLATTESADVRRWRRNGAWGLDKHPFHWTRMCRPGSTNRLPRPPGFVLWLARRPGKRKPSAQPAFHPLGEHIAEWQTSRASRSDRLGLCSSRIALNRRLGLGGIRAPRRGNGVHCPPMAG